MKDWASRFAYSVAVWGLTLRDRLRSKCKADFVIFKPDRIGDFVLATGVLHLIEKELDSKVKVCLVVSEFSEPLARLEFPSWEIVPIKIGGCTFRTGLISNGIINQIQLAVINTNMLVNLRYHMSLPEAIAIAQIDYRKLISIAISPLAQLLPDRLASRFTSMANLKYPSAAMAGICLEIEAHRNVAEVVLKRQVLLKEVLPALRAVAHTDGGYLLVLPHGSASIRTYPINLLARAVADAVKGTGMRVQLCGEANRVGELRDLKAQLQANLIDAEIVYPQGLLGFVQTVADASIVVSMESAGAHISAALDKPLVAIVGGGHFGYFAPWQKSSRQRWLHEPLDCYGCNWTCRQIYPKCIHDISPDRVSFEIRSLIGESRVN